MQYRIEFVLTSLINQNIQSYRNIWHEKHLLQQHKPYTIITFDLHDHFYFLQILCICRWAAKDVFVYILKGTASMPHVKEIV